MKTRNGFISNSSSSSFLIYGIQLGSFEWTEEEYELTQTAEQMGLNVYDLDWATYLGLEWDQVQDNETGAQFKERVKNMLTELLKKEPTELGTYSEAWYDG
jgi:hypothetical protein